MDPYNEIYREEELYYRLANPDWLNPEQEKRSRNWLISNQTGINI